MIEKEVLLALGLRCLFETVATPGEEKDGKMENGAAVSTKAHAIYILDT